MICYNEEHMSQKVIVNQETCIGCNTCPLIDPDTFELDTTTYKANVKKQPDTINEKITTAVSSCPVGAISVVEE
jgi:ferredoxin